MITLLHFYHYYTTITFIIKQITHTHASNRKQEKKYTQGFTTKRLFIFNKPKFKDGY